MVNNIPKIIHHIAPQDTELWVDCWSDCYASWKKTFPEDEYQHIVWNDEEGIRNVVSEEHPHLLSLYDSLPVKVMKIDLAKLCILYKHGGIYADMDIYCYKNFYSLLKNDLYILESWVEWGESIQNSLMIANKGNPTIKKCIDSVTYKEYNTEHETVMNFCGSHYMEQFKPNFSILSKEEFNPKVQFPFNNTCDKNLSWQNFKWLNLTTTLIYTRHYLTGKWY